jgi:hypothetical protein
MDIDPAAQPGFIKSDFEPDCHQMTSHTSRCRGFRALHVHSRATAPAALAAVVRLWLIVEELRGGAGVHDVGPHLFFGSHGSLGHGVIGHPRVEFAAGYEAEDGGDQPSGD